MLKNTSDKKVCIFPIGYLYISLSDVEPSTLFGGTWERLKGVFPFACNTEYPAGTIGGEEKHILTVDEMPNHNHKIYIPNGSGSYSINGYGINDYTNPPFNTWGASLDVGYIGGSQAHNNMPPFKAFYMWVRTA